MEIAKITLCGAVASQIEFEDLHLTLTSWLHWKIDQRLPSDSCPNLASRRELYYTQDHLGICGRLQPSLLKSHHVFPAEI
jgi:hypothetical protein